MGLPIGPRRLVVHEVKLPVPPEQAWELLVDEESQQQWLGSGSLIPIEGFAQIAVNGQVWRRGSVPRTNLESMSLKAELTAASGWDPSWHSSLTIGVQPDPDDVNGSSVIQISESADSEPEGLNVKKEIEAFWAGAVTRLEELTRDVVARREPAQAIVVIHGIGEQLPGKTLSGFVDAVITDTGKQKVRSKPDRISESKELRRLSLARFGAVRPKTDFYELYWAHQMGDTTVWHALGWLWRLLRIRRKEVLPPLRVLWLIGWGLAGLLSLGLVYAAATQFRSEGALAALGSVSILVSVSVAIVGGTVAKGIGDAARYLSARPENVDARERVREQGIALIRRLHDSGRYSRVLLVGHSLGSVIAYDIITNLWAEMNADHLAPRKNVNRATGRLNRYTEADVSRAQQLQHQAWHEIRRNTQPWLITDLITLGSPLTYAKLLMTTGTDIRGARVARDSEWGELVKRREVPTCPPIRDDTAEDKTPAFYYQENFRNRDGFRHKTFRYLHHAAPFAVVRWTNLYFETWLGLLRDPIGGPVKDPFGDWVRDVPLQPPADWRKRTRLWLHSAYWRPSACDDSKTPKTPLGCLREAMDLDSFRDLERETQTHSPTMYLREPAA